MKKESIPDLMAELKSERLTFLILKLPASYKHVKKDIERFIIFLSKIQG